jgi:2Fe-2S ferredoxin
VNLVPTIHYVDRNGQQVRVQTDAGSSLMQAAVDNGVDGIVARCGGYLSCATCHCYIDDAYLPQLPAPDPTERFLLGMTHEPQANSRLSCQVVLTDELDGMVVTLPERQE